MEAVKPTSFPTLNQIIEYENINFADVGLKKKFNAEFDKYEVGIFKYNWVRMPFDFDVNDLHKDLANIKNLKEEFIYYKK